LPINWTPELLEEWRNRRRNPSYPLARDIAWLRSIGLYDRPARSTTQEDHQQ
jgi:hypothetical protein